MPYWFLSHAQFGLICVEWRFGAKDNLKMSKTQCKKREKWEKKCKKWENAHRENCHQYWKTVPFFFVLTRLYLVFLKIGYPHLFGKMSHEKQRGKISSYHQEVRIFWQLLKDHFNPDEEKGLSPFIREINPSICSAHDLQQSDRAGMMHSTREGYSSFL